MKPLSRMLSGTVLLAGLTVLSCADNHAVRIRYQAEKLFFEADRLMQNARIRPELNDPRALATVRNAYDELVRFCMTAIDSVSPSANPIEYREMASLTHRSSIRLCQLYFATHRYDSCAEVIARLVAKVPLETQEAAGAQVLMGQALQASGTLDSAFACYRRGVDLLNPPLDGKGEIVFNVFNVPAHLVSLYAQLGDSLKADEAFAQASGYYGAIASGKYGARPALASSAMLARLNTDRGNWNAAIAALEKLVDSSGVLNRDAKLRIADLRAAELGDFDMAIRYYDELLADLKGRDTMMKPVLFFKKSLVLLEMKQYETARQLLVQIQTYYPGYFATDPLPQYTKARSFESEGNWNRAETEYKYLIDNYPPSEQTFSTLLYLADQYTKMGRTIESDKLLEQARQTYDQAAVQGAGTPLEALALMYKSELLRRQQQWRPSAEALVAVSDRFPGTEFGRNALITAVNVYRQKLNDPATADSLVRAYVTKMTRLDEDRI
ncbi:MAG: tetratricopeptide repeat protein [Candidatus Zixiibacteriota bacterium]